MTIMDNPFEEVLESEQPWTIRNIGNNAISGIVNDPNLQAKQGQKPLPGMDRLPTVPPTVIRKVRLSEFDPYFKMLADVFDKYQLNRAVGLAAATEGMPLLGNVDQPSPSFMNLEDLTTKLGVLAPERGKSRGNLGLTPSQRSRLLSTNAGALESVPSVFLDPEFNLGNPHTFSLVCENADVTSTSGQEATTSNGILQEKLSHYLDTVEVHLIKEISRRSSSFFAALSNLQALHQETLACVAQIGVLRQKLGNISKSSARKGLEVVRLKRRRGNLGILYGGVKLVSEVRQTQPMIQVLLTQGDYVGALDLIEQTGMVLRGFDLSGKPTDDATQSSTLTEGVKLTRNVSIIPTALDLRGVRSLANLHGQLTEMSKTIGMVMETEFVNVLLGDIRETLALMDQSRISPRIKDAPANAWIQNILTGRHSPHVTAPGAVLHSSLLAREDKLRSRLVPLVLGLLRMDKLGSALQSCKDALTSEIKAMIKKYYPPLTGSPETPRPGSPMVGSPMSPTMSKKKEQQSALARQLRSMTFDSFFDLMVNVYVTLLHILQRVAITHELVVLIVKEAQDGGVIIGADSVKIAELNNPDQKRIEEHPHRLRRKKTEDEDDDFGSLASLPDVGFVAKEVEKPGSTSADQGVEGVAGSSTYGQMVSESSDLLFAASDLANVRCARLIGVRSEQNAQLNPKDFYRLFSTTWEFVAGGENLCGRLCLGLKGTMLSQAKGFISHFHEEKSRQIAVLVENEQWAQAQVPIDFQRLTDHLVSNAAGVPASDSVGNNAEELHTEHEDEGEDDVPSVAQAGQGENSQRFLMIGGRRYYVVGCALLLLKMLTEYMQCIENIPDLTTEVSNRIGDILKVFNSRTCQVILGAGATRSAGLKNIKARHISLAAQSLGVGIAIIPHVKTAIQRSLPAKQQQIILGDFDRLLGDYRHHQNELYMKLVSIMNERRAALSEKLRAIDWDNPNMEKDFHTESGVSMYMEMLHVMANVFQSFSRHLEEDLKTIELFSGAGKNRLLIDVQYYIHHLSTLDGIDGPGNHLEVVVNNIRIRDRRTVATQNPSTQNARGTGTVPTTSNSNIAAGALQGGNAPTGRSASVDLPGRSSGGAAPNALPIPGGGAAGGAGAPQRMGNFATAFGKMLRSQNAGLAPNDKTG
ncbi:hypothetical protein HK104_007207 [Borealophlyctis nickersoniae]|nr:hypothetical protein HK104_007207 [Borealophlyctis nickersoniae]